MNRAQRAAALVAEIAAADTVLAHPADGTPQQLADAATARRCATHELDRVCTCPAGSFQSTTAA